MLLCGPGRPGRSRRQHPVLAALVAPHLVQTGENFSTDGARGVHGVVHVFHVVGQLCDMFVADRAVAST